MRFMNFGRTVTRLFCESLSIGEIEESYLTRPSLRVKHVEFRPRHPRVIPRLINFLERQSQRKLLAFSILTIILLGTLDVYTGVEIHFLLLYLIPVFVASWFVSRNAGLSLAFFASVVWFAADSLNGRSYSSGWIAYWNLLMRTGVFVIFTITQAQLRARIVELSHLAQVIFLHPARSRFVNFFSKPRYFVFIVARVIIS
jgi:hypothetical protein